MTYPCTIKRLIGDQWQARSLGSDVGDIEIIAASRRQAIEGLRDAIGRRLAQRARGAGGYVELEIRESARTPWRGTVF